VATAVLLDRTPAPPASERVSMLDPLSALRHRATRGSGLVAAFYNFGFFTLLAYTPFALGLGAHQLGYIFCAWGVMLAVFAVFTAPAVSRRFGDIRGLAGALAGIAVLLAVMGALHASQTALIVCVIVAGSFLGITNTLMTQVVMESAPVPRPVASAAYSFVRFCGGAIAPFVAGKLGEHVSVASPFYLGAGMTAIAIVVLWHYREALVPVAEPEPATAPAGAFEPAPAAAGPAPMLVAVGGPAARQIAAMTVPVARARGGAVHVLHVIERDVVAGEDAIDLETQTEAVALLDAAMAELSGAGVPVTGEIVHSTGTHAEVAARIMDRAARLPAGLIVIGADTERPGLHGGIAAHVVAHAPSHVIVLNPRAGALGRAIPSVAGEADARGLWHAT
jgi:MFS transporter, ACDE family, multidrug resistance protein